MEETLNTNITDTIINTINTIFENLFSSIDNSLYSILDDITFINTNILDDPYFDKIFGSSSSNGLLLIANSLLVGFILYFAAKFLFSNLTYSPIESPKQFIFKLIIFGLCMNLSEIIVERSIFLLSNISLAIRELGANLFNTEICFSNLINKINNSIAINSSTINIFSIDGLIKGALTISLLNLVFSYALRYVMVKIFILLTPFAFLSLCLENTSWFFKAWLRNFFSLFFIQILVSIVLLILFSMDFSSAKLVLKFIYLGAIYALIKVNSFVREFIGGPSTDFSLNVNSFFKK